MCGIPSLVYSFVWIIWVKWPLNISRKSIFLLLVCRPVPTLMTAGRAWPSAPSRLSTTPPPSNWSTIPGRSTPTEPSALKNVHVSPTTWTHSKPDQCITLALVLISLWSMVSFQTSHRNHFCAYVRVLVCLVLQWQMMVLYFTKERVSLGWNKIKGKTRLCLPIKTQGTLEKCSLRRKAFSEA